MSRAARCVRCSALWMWLGLMCPLAAWGQAPPPAPAPGAAAPVVPMTFAPRISPLDAAITVALMGAAIFAVCRSSKRV